ncbi:sulfotransferase family protein [Sinimarinibacterium flocculans]|uniref:sulfotransferase family protein n=1 Tax=Sinimarinibacterium flocculans TaxID=985250 RepID=UPI003C755288
MMSSFDRDAFLIIGAMKAGTTSLYADLCTHPAIFMPANKEPESLATDDVLTPGGRRRYAQLFGRARPGQWVGEASTAYTKWPDQPDAARRAKDIWGPDLKVIYMVREPVARIVSHYNHDVQEGVQRAPFSEALRRDSRYLDYTRYARQLEFWLAEFGADAVKVLRFEDYVANKPTALAQLATHLGVPVDGFTGSDGAANASDGKLLAPAWLRQGALRSHLYLNVVKPMLPAGMRAHAKRWLSRRASPALSVADVSDVERSWIRAQLGTSIAPWYGAAA